MSKMLEGKPSPKFELPCTSNLNVSDQAMKGKKYVLFFYPKDNTPG